MVSTGWYSVLPRRIGAIEPIVYSICTKMSGSDCIDYVGIGGGNQNYGNLHVHTLYSDRIPLYLEKPLGHRLAHQMPYNLSLAKKIVELHNKEPFDIIHIHDANSGFATSFLKKMLNIPYVFTVHNEIKSALSVQDCDKFLTVSEYIKNFLIEKRKIDSKLIEVVYLAVDSDTHKPTKSVAESKKALGLEDFTILLFVGRKCPEKGPQVLIKALPEIVKLKARVLAIFVGPDYFYNESDGTKNYSKQLLELAQNMGVLKNVLFESFITDEKLRLYYMAADVLVCPSIWQDPCPQVVKEALSYAKPVVASDVGGIPDVITHGYSGLLVSPNNPSELVNAVDSLLNDDVFAATLGCNGRRVIKEKFSVKVTSENYLRVYREVCSKKV